MLLRVLERGKHRDVVIRQGEVRLGPGTGAHGAHSPVFGGVLSSQPFLPSSLPDLPQPHPQALPHAHLSPA